VSDEARRHLVVLALTAALLFGYPVLAVVDALGRCCLPAALPLWIFFAWAAVILLARLIVVRDRGPR
jgi:hypothetical protein